MQINCESRGILTVRWQFRCPLWVISGHVHALTDVRFTPESEPVRCGYGCPPSANSGHRQLFDHLVCADEQDCRDFETERFGGSQIDQQFELGRLHNR
jgi:hypothetical protein